MPEREIAGPNSDLQIGFMKCRNSAGKGTEQLLTISKLEFCFPEDQSEGRAIVISDAESAFEILQGKRLMQPEEASRLDHSICLTFVRPSLQVRRSKACFALSMALGQEATRHRRRASLTWRDDTSPPSSFGT